MKEVQCVTSPEFNPYAVVTIGLIIYDSFVLVCFSGQPDFWKPPLLTNKLKKRFLPCRIKVEDVKVFFFREL